MIYYLSLSLSLSLFFFLFQEKKQRLEICGKINTVERMKLIDVIEDVNGRPKVRDTLEMLKKE